MLDCSIIIIIQVVIIEIVMFINGEIIIHFWMILYGNFHPFFDQEHPSLRYRYGLLNKAQVGRVSACGL